MAFEKAYPTTLVSSIFVIGREGNDEISVEATRAGVELSINAGVGDNFVFLGGSLRNLTNIQGM